MTPILFPLKALDIVICILFLGVATVIAHANDESVLPGSEISLEKAVSHPGVDVIATGVIVQLGGGMPRQEVMLFPDAKVKITKMLRGSCENPVTLWIPAHMGRHETVKEGVEYIIFMGKAENGVRPEGKMMPANRQTVAKVMAAIAAAKPPPVTPTPPSPKPQPPLGIPGLN